MVIFKCTFFPPEYTELGAAKTVVVWESVKNLSFMTLKKPLQSFEFQCFHLATRIKAASPTPPWCWHDD